MNEHILNMLDEIDEQYISEVRIPEDNHKTVKKYTVMRYAAACLVGLAGIGAAAFGIVKMNGGGKGTENIGIVGEVTESERTWEETVCDIPEDRIVINRDENNYYTDADIFIGKVLWDRINPYTTYMNRTDICKYYGLEKFNSNIDSIMKEWFGEEYEYIAQDSPYLNNYEDTGDKKYGIYTKGDKIFDENIIVYQEAGGHNNSDEPKKEIRIILTKATNCENPEKETNSNVTKNYNMNSIISGKEMYINNVYYIRTTTTISTGEEIHINNIYDNLTYEPVKLNNCYEAVFYEGETKIHIIAEKVDESSFIKLIKLIVEKGM